MLILGTGVDGNQAGETFTVHYAVGTSATFAQDFSDWYTPQGYANELTAATMSYHDTSGGGTSGGPLYLNGYAEALNSGMEQTVRRTESVPGWRSRRREAGRPRHIRMG